MKYNYCTGYSLEPCTWWQISVHKVFTVLVLFNIFIVCLLIGHLWQRQLFFVYSNSSQNHYGYSYLKKKKWSVVRTFSNNWVLWGEISLLMGKVQENQKRVLQTLILQNTELFSECILMSLLSQLYYIEVSLRHITHYNWVLLCVSIALHKIHVCATCTLSSMYSS